MHLPLSICSHFLLCDIALLRDIHPEVRTRKFIRVDQFYRSVVCLYAFKHDRQTDTRAVQMTPGFLATLALAPLPFASNRPWSWSLLSMIVGLLMLAWGAAAWRDRTLVAVSWRRVWPFLLMFAVIVGWIALQASGATPASWHHPAWAAAAATAKIGYSSIMEGARAAGTVTP